MERALSTSLLVFTLLLSFPARASDWPASGAWAPLTREGVPLSDTADLAGTNSVDIIGDNAASWYVSDQDLFVRINVESGSFASNPYAMEWGVWIDRGGDGCPDGLFVARAERLHDLAVEAWSVDGCTSRAAEHRLDVGALQGAGDDGGFVDLRFSVGALATLVGARPSDPLRMVLSTRSGESADALTLADVAGVSGTGGAFPPEGSLSDPIYVDQDDDGVNTFDELDMGTDPAVADTDADGVEDGRELAVGSDPLDSDTDADGLTDGDELYVEGSSPLDPDSDDDGLTDGDEIVAGTDPMAADSDGDGIGDAAEVECGSGPAWDRDGDGIDDQAEGRRDTDGDGAPDWCDTDSDDDGIDDQVEGAVDTDGDGVPDFQDLDSDGDRLDDASEGTLDSDGDGIPDRIDAHDDSPIPRPREDPATPSPSSDTGCATVPVAPSASLSLLPVLLRLLLGRRIR